MPQASASCKRSYSQPRANFSSPIDRGFGNIQQFGGFIGGESKKEAKLDHAAFARVQLVQFIQNPIQIHHLDRAGAHPCQLFIQGNGDAAITLLPSLLSGMIEQHAPHQARREAVEMFAIFKAQVTLPDQLEEQLIHDAGGLQDVFWPLAAEKCAGNLSQLGIHDVKKPIDGVGSSLAPLAQEFCNFTSLTQAGQSFQGDFGGLDSSAKARPRHANF